MGALRIFYREKTQKFLAPKPNPAWRRRKNQRVLGQSSTVPPTMNNEKLFNQRDGDDRDEKKKAPLRLETPADSTTTEAREDRKAAGRTDGTAGLAAITSSTEHDSAKGASATTVAAASRSSADAKADDDMDVAHRLQAIEQLTSIFGFPLNVAEDTVDTVGWDVTTCYNYILDQNMAEDSGGPIVPIDNCPHLQQHVRITASGLIRALEGKRPQDALCSHGKSAANQQQAPQPSSSSVKGSLKEDVYEDGSCPSKENWMCLECGAIRCSRYQNGHALVHWEETKRSDETGEGNCIAVSFSDLSVWCYLCNSYVRHRELLDPLLQQLEKLKFGLPIGT